MTATRDTSDLILRRLWDRLAANPGDKDATRRLAAEIKRRQDLARIDYGPTPGVRISADGMLIHYAEHDEAKHPRDDDGRLLYADPVRINPDGTLAN